MSDWAVQLIGALLVATPGILALVLGRRKVKSEASEIITQSALKLLEPQNARIQALETENERMESEIAELKIENHKLSVRMNEFEKLLIGAHMLYDQVLANNLQPVYVPPERRKTTGGLRNAASG